ncbi:Glucose-induced degradation protein 4-like protein [Psilocybe cubensis]|uniref:Glucose-induced degradation protein 4-like protein n=2 Tax=Psilocybe cubensis TaxID=181762 RepID=A0ACB8H6S1_PSICU|nr:Glucose-induced degradation protein 4-like protein [Psilocybe cubensis]KAH9483678.1 Glucose-induced degradation protein 4-like protein [Psilocybe cubensis]
MPSEQYAQHAPPEHALQPTDAQKLCYACQNTLQDPAASLYCTTCRPSATHHDQQHPAQLPRRAQEHQSLPEPHPATPYRPPTPPPSSPYASAKKATLSTLQCSGVSTNIASPTSPSPSSVHRSQQSQHQHQYQQHFAAETPAAAVPQRYNGAGAVAGSSQSYLDPLVDITRLRIRTRAHHCLYPGAMFQGTQKSGRNSYDVNVTIVDVNFAASTLCGYLRIRGLTDDWPELTTYFDAEIIGNRYGFLTQNWGASQHEDIVHWSRFPAFKHIRHEAQRPYMTLDDRDRGVVFMRWKERFLVPDHRVQDINGASFAGFYYVCVDFNPPATPASPTPTLPSCDSALDDSGNLDSAPIHHMPAITPEDEELAAHQQHAQAGAGVDMGMMDLDMDMGMEDLQNPYSTSTSPPRASRVKAPGRSRSRRASSVRRRGPSLAPVSPAVATMSGFYYHQNSEPYQQLSLAHVPESTSSSFEFR